MSPRRDGGARREYDRLVAAAILLWTAAHALLLVLRHRALATSAFDLGLYWSALESTLQGRPMEYPWGPGQHFAEHFSPVLFALVPLAAVWRSPVALLVLVPLALALSAWLLFRLLVRRSLPPPLAAAVAIAYLLSRPVHGIVASAFHPEAFEPLLFALLLAWGDEGRRLRVALAALLLLACKEDVGLPLAGAAVHLAWRHARDRPFHLAVAAAALLWSAIAVTWVIPLFAGDPPGLSSYPFLRFWSPASEGIPGDAGSASAGDRAAKLLSLLAPVLALPLARGRDLVLWLPTVALLASSRSPLHWGFALYYPSPFLLQLYLVTGAVLASLVSRRPRAAGAVAVLMLIVHAANAPVARSLPESLARANPARPAALARALAGSEGERRLVQANLFPHAAGDRATGVLGRCGPHGEVVLVDFAVDPYPLSERQVGTWLRCVIASRAGRVRVLEQGLVEARIRGAACPPPLAEACPQGRQRPDVDGGSRAPWTRGPPPRRAGAGLDWTRQRAAAAESNAVAADATASAASSGTGGGG